MTFNSSAFALLLIVVGVLYGVFQFFGKWRWQNIILLVASYVFYGAWDVRFLFLINIATSLDFLVGLGITGKRPSIASLLLIGFSWVIFGFIAIAPEITISSYLLGAPNLQPLAEQVSDSGVPERNSAFVAISLASLLFAALLGFGFFLQAHRRPKYFIILSLIGNLGLLSIFKYYDFFVSSFASMMDLIGYSVSPYTVGLILPVGISFYTFQTLSYTIDIYRNKLQATDNYVDFALFVTYFPQLVAGPIERAEVLLPRIQGPRVLDAFGLQSGFYLLAWGLYKKIFVADNLARLVNPAYDTNLVSDAPYIYIATAAFAMQIYCDFSGYTDIARGVSRMLGIELMVNFNTPYMATNPREFWRRWHISLSTWLRDYLYIPLGGSKKGTLLNYRNLMITMILGGLWHGARGNFLLWGVFQGVILCGHRLIEQKLVLFGNNFRAVPRLWKFVCWLVFAQFILFGWLLFRANGSQHAFNLIAGLGSGWSTSLVYLPILARFCWFSWLVLVVDIAAFRTGNLLKPMDLPWYWKTIFYLVLFYSITIFGSFDDVQFIYFQF